MNEISFTYNGKLYCPKNPDKKLRQLKITWADVQIINKEIKKEESKEYGVEGKEVRYFLHPNGMKTMCYVPIGENPKALDYFKDVMWNGSTGIKWCTKDYLEKLVLL